ncbi:hypothetical protein NN6n1_18470 [Shinella zoogloeoides]
MCLPRQFYGNSTADAGKCASDVGSQPGIVLEVAEPSELLGRYILRRMEGGPPEALQALIMPQLIERSDDRLA